MEIAEYLDLSSDEVKVANNIKRRQVSFDMPVSQDGDNEFSLYDLVQTGNIPSPDTDIMTESTVTNINRALQKLTPREAEILTMSFGLRSSPIFTLHDIALKYGMSSERVRRIKNDGLFKLKTLLKGNYAFLDY